MSHHTAQALSDVVPGHEGPFPPVVVRFANALCSLSVQKRPVLPQNAEVARHHICAYLAAEKYAERTDMAAPSLNMIPVPPKIATRVIDEFRNSFMAELGTPASSPATTPRANKVVNFASGESGSPNLARSTPNGSPRRLAATTPHKSSPLKRVRKAATGEDSTEPTPKRSLAMLRDADSPFNPKTNPLDRPRGLESPTPPADDAAYKVQYRSDKRHMSLSEFVAICNHFYIPAVYTAQMLRTFVSQRHRYAKKSEWLLACGMVHAAYVRINHRLLAQKMGARTDFQNQLFQYQVGGLARWNMLLWCNIVDSTVRDEPWIAAIENTYVYRDAGGDVAARVAEADARSGPQWRLMARFGSMIDQDVHLANQEKYYKTWTARAKEACSNTGALGTN